MPYNNPYILLESLIVHSNNVHTSGNLVQFNDLRAFDGLGIFFFNEGPAGIPGGGGAPIMLSECFDWLPGGGGAIGAVGGGGAGGTAEGGRAAASSPEFHQT